VIDGVATLTRGAGQYTVQRGSRLYEGDILNVQSRLQLISPYGAFTLTKGKGLLKIILSRQEGCGLRMLLSYFGRISVNARTRTCSNTTAVFESLQTGASFDAWGGLRAMRLYPGTVVAQAIPPLGSISFVALDRGNASVLAVTKGTISVQNEGQTRNVPAGHGNLTAKGQPPGSPLALDEELKLQKLKLERTPKGLKINATINPLNTLLVQGKEVSPQSVVPWPIVSNDLRVGVRNLTGDRTRYYIYPLPGRK
jgi:hypothetical protein